MPEKRTMERARRDRRQGKAASTQAGEFVREEIHHVREGKHGARSAKQAIAIGLSKARRAGVAVGGPRRAKRKTKRASGGTTPRGARAGATSRRAANGNGAGTGTATTRGGHRRGAGRKPASARRSQATRRALRREGSAAASHRALSRQARGAANRRAPAQRAAAARRAARTQGAAGRSAAARKGARTRRESRAGA